jgi:hypothetical protein
MKFENFARQSSNNFPDDTKGFKGAFLDYLNNILASVFVGLGGRLTFLDNFYCQEIKYKFTHGVEVAFKNSKSKRPIGILPVIAENQMITGYQMGYNQKNEILITLEFKAGAGTQADCTVYVLGGD